MAERKQISMWISAESAALLQRLADEQSQPKNRIIELALAAYATSEPTSNDTSDLLDWRTELSNRLLALETRLGALEAVGAIGVGAVGKEAQNVACEPVGVVLETVDAASEIEPGAVKEADMPTGADSTSCDAVVIIQGIDKFKAAVVTAYKEGMRGYAEILRKITASGYRNSNGNEYTRHSVKECLIAAGLVRR